MSEDNNKKDEVVEENSDETQTFEPVSEKAVADKDLIGGGVADEEISDGISRTTNVGHIENIERVEIKSDDLNRFLSYFPHLVVGLISVVAMAGMVYIALKNDGGDPTEAARSLITYLVAVITIVIALILTLMAFFSTLPDLKERFALGKEVLTILIGVLGTIVGFYYGSAPKEPARVTPTPSPTAAASPNPGTTAAANITVDKSRQQLVAELETKGFSALLAQDFDTALNSFQQAYQVWGDYHNVDEIRRLLQKQSEKFALATAEQQNVIWSETYCEIIPKYQWGMSTDIKTQFQQTIKTKNYICPQTQ